MTRILVLIVQHSFVYIIPV